MPSVDRQIEVRADLLEFAESDATITGAAITGSWARGTADSFSDIDLFLCYKPGTDVPELLDKWTSELDDRFGVIHYFDLAGNDAVYRVFLIQDLLEVDIGFTDEAHFHTVGGEPFNLVFGTPAPLANEAPTPQDQRTLLGYAWHHILHAQVCLNRNRMWQALFWTNGLRDILTTLACRRLGLPDYNAKGVDALPSQTRDQLRGTLVQGLDKASGEAALISIVDMLVKEIGTREDQASALLSSRLQSLRSHYT